MHVRMLLAIRAQRHWSQAELAQHLGVSTRTVLRWENQIGSDPHPVWLRPLRLLLEEN